MTDIILILGLVMVGALLIWMALRKPAADPTFVQAMQQLQTAQAEQAGRLQQLAAMAQAQQAELTRSLNERLDGLGRRMSDHMQTSIEKTGEGMQRLEARLAVLDDAQKNLTDLSGRMLGLQDILSNKQDRGAFGEVQLENLVQDALPPAAYAFQSTLSNGRRVDCLIHLPKPPGSIAIDAKFPLEGWRALAAAKTDVEETAARKQLSQDVIRHVNDIAERYILPGETADGALLFLPSEAIYAELHARLPNVIETARRKRIFIVSPSTLWATLATVRAVLRDVKMREQAHLIQIHVAKMTDDVRRLIERADKLRSHFALTQKDVEEILTSVGKIERHGEKIADVSLEEEGRPPVLPAS